MRRILGLVVIAGSCLCVQSTANAAPILGQLNLAGDVRVTQSAIDWVPPVMGNTGQFFIGTTSTGDFGGFPLGTQGTAKDLDSTLQPVGVPFLLTDYLLLPNPTNDIAFDLTFIAPGTFGSAECAAAPADDQRCTPILPPGFGLSPFELSNTATNGDIDSTVAFRISGFVRNVDTGELSSFTGTYTAQFEVPYQTVLAELAQFGEVRNTYSGTLVADVIPVPEPALTLLLGTALVGVAARLRGRRRSR